MPECLRLIHFSCRYVGLPPTRFELTLVLSFPDRGYSTLVPCAVIPYGLEGFEAPNAPAEKSPQLYPASSQGKSWLMRHALGTGP